LQISQAIFDIEEATEEAFDIILAHKVEKSFCFIVLSSQIPFSLVYE
jgi:hypothetical protein